MDSDYIVNFIQYIALLGLLNSLVLKIIIYHPNRKCIITEET